MKSIYYLNKISPEGTKLWPEDYTLTQELAQADGLLVRSASMHDMALPDTLLAVARAGAGVNNIPLERCAEMGIPVFNTPGANARSVMELTLCGALLASRDIIGGSEWVKTLAGAPDAEKQVEKGKSRFAGHELLGRRLGVIGLGAVGGPLANAAVELGMEVCGCDPFISVDAAWHVDSRVRRVRTREEIYESCDIISLHTPLVDDTRGMINADAIAKMRDGAIVLNFARGALVDDEAMAQALESGKVSRYVTDFPNARTADMPGCIAIPHLGASTQESEDNCARMAVREMTDYLENGNLTHCVNYPDCDMGVCTAAERITILHGNIPNSLSRFTTAVASEGVNIAGLMNKSRGRFAYTMLDLDHHPSEAAVENLRQIEGVYRVRVIKAAEAERK